MASDAIKEYFDEDKYNELIEQEVEEKTEYRAELKQFVNEMKDE